MSRPILLIACLALTATACTAQAPDDLASASEGGLPPKIAESRTVVVGNVPNYPPLEFKDPSTNKLTGFDIDLGNAVGKQLGVTMKWQETSFEQLQSAVTTGRIDMILSGMSDLPERRKTLDLVGYLRSGAQFFSTTKVDDQKRLCGKSVGASRRTSFPGEIKKWSEENCGGKAIKVLGTEGSADARTQLTQGRVDAAVQGSETLPYIFEQDPGKFHLIGEPFTEVHQAMGFGKQDPRLRDAVIRALRALQQDGTYASLLDKWGLKDNAIEQVTLNGTAAP
ncbi:ABC transporter substrate-binding protein [Nonomuraea sp. KC401]|uniref:ABC transporter substrate-binding protein n=1 Tax=unclassified Nonomuraea TaxID=2593643 RepID=UPI0010FCFF37|nr:ABC transporter substrate-binding protein [Nonomuraea sp. KC401]NBE96664.1 transporter substrate-binding domain-containing protein [Nonomuraea sp. K271]TLF67974.1 ABC transporter substrate-binding protein [Nonomuraea sp. KC401]